MGISSKTAKRNFQEKIEENYHYSNVKNNH